MTNGDDPMQSTNDPYNSDPSGMPPRNMYGNEEPPYNDYSPQREPPLMAPPPEGYNPDQMRRSPSIGSHGRGKHVAMDTGRFALIFSAVMFSMLLFRPLQRLLHQFHYVIGRCTLSVNTC